MDLVRQWLIRFGVFSMVTLLSPLQSEPNPPKEPTLPNFISETRDARGDKPSSNAPVTRKNVSVTLCDGREVKGFLDLRNDGLQFSHTKEGIQYKKRIGWNELYSIRIESWELKPKTEDKKGIPFDLLPSRIRLQTKTGERYFKENGVADFQFLNLTIENANGQAQLFTYWVDLKYPNGTWFSGLPPLPGAETFREDCFKDVVRSVVLED